MKIQNSGDPRRRRYVGVPEIIAVIIFVLILVVIVMIFAATIHGRPILGKSACEYPQQMWGEPQRVYLECLREQQRRFLEGGTEQWRLAP